MTDTNNDSSLFDTDFSGASDPNVTQEDLFEALVGEGKKYKNQQELAKAVLYKDEFIDRLKSEAAQRREAEVKGRTVDDLIAAVRNANKTNVQKTDDDSGESDYDSAPPNKQRAPDPEELVNKVLQALETKNLQESQKQNLATVQSTLVKLFGRNYEPELERVAQDAGLTKEEIDGIARKDPERLFKVLRLNPNSNSAGSLFSPPANGQRTEQFNDTSGVRTANFYDALRKKDPIAYWSSKVQAQRHRDATKLGEKFFTS
jgi:hypothetical protein